MISRRFIEISLGIESSDFKRMADIYLVRWDLVQLRCSNFMGCTLVERLALALLELAENFGVEDPLGLRLTVSTRHKDLAELVGASRPRVTEYLNEFERKRMIIVARSAIDRKARSAGEFPRPAAYLRHSSQRIRYRTYSVLLLRG